MSLAVVHSRALLGMQAPEVRVEVHLGNGLPAFHLVGLPQAAVRESADRVRAALVHCGFEFPNRRLTVNLAPADLPKDSGRFDLPIAVGILAASGQVSAEALHAFEFVGELSLTGAIQPVRGVLPMLLALRASGTLRRLVMPTGCETEAALLPDCQALSANSLADVFAHLCGSSSLVRIEHQVPIHGKNPAGDFSEVCGQAFAKRALEVAAAGGHSALMIGPPGSGKTMLAQRFASLLPELSAEQAIECAAIRSISIGFDPATWGDRPVRAPHHTASAVALVGGGNIPRPGEITLAHHGVLFLDELPEFDSRVLDVLREPLESGEITISRAARQASFPARFQLIAAMNPCPCGYGPTLPHLCSCRPESILRYQRSVSGPLLDRIDIRIHVAPVSAQELAQAPAPDHPQHRVLSAHQRQQARQQLLNAQLPVGALNVVCSLTDSARQLLDAAAQKLSWSARGHHRVLRVARTIADLAGHDQIDAPHLAEAIQYRRPLSNAADCA
jgi:magnesium chelatase family protein